MSTCCRLVQRILDADVLVLDRAHTMFQSKTVVVAHEGPAELIKLHARIHDASHQSQQGRERRASVAAMSEFSDSNRDKEIEVLSGGWAFDAESKTDLTECCVAKLPKENRSLGSLRGAADRILVKATHRVRSDAEEEQITPEIRKELLTTLKGHLKGLCRVVAVAEVRPARITSLSEAEQVVLIGFLVLEQPPHASCSAHVATLRQTFSTIVVVSGDAEQALEAACSKVGVSVSRVVTGTEWREKPVFESENVMYARMGEQERIEVVKSAQLKGRKVMYLAATSAEGGACAAAHVGMCVKPLPGSNLGEKADIVLSKSASEMEPLQQLIQVLRLAKRIK